MILKITDNQYGRLS